MNSGKKHLDWVKGYFREACRTQVLENFLGAELTSLRRGRVRCAMKVRGEHGNIYGTVHGGTLAAISDFAMGVACVTTGRRVVTIDMNISYIKGAPAAGRLTAEGSVVSEGKRIMRAEGKVFCGRQLLVRAQASYYVTGEFHAGDFPRPAPAAVR